LYRSGSIVLSVAIIALGVAMLALTLVRGGGPLSAGFVMGLLFCGFGAARLYLWRER
jgi:hypothetical protein